MVEQVMNTYTRQELVFESGRGSYLYDDKGDSYLDFVAGVAVNALGHSHPLILEAIDKQSKKLMHISNLYWTKEQMTLAEKLIDKSEHKAAFFCNSGAESIETAIKISRKYGKRSHPHKHKILYR